MRREMMDERWGERSESSARFLFFEGAGVEFCASLSSSMATTRIPFMAFRKDASAAGGADRPPRREVGAPVSRSSGTQPRSSRLRMELTREMMDEERDDG
jgi:hypothetical protein